MTPRLPPDVEPVDAPPCASGPILLIVVGAMLTLCAVVFVAGYATEAWQAQCEAVE